MNYCLHMDQEIEFVADIQRAELNDEQNISFLLFHCRNCGKFFSFPKQNLNMALRKGLPETKFLLKSYGVSLAVKIKN